MLFRNSFTAGKSEVRLDTLTSPTLNALGDIYRLFRFTRVKVTLLPYETASMTDDTIACAFLPGAPVTAVPIDEIESAHFVSLSLKTTTPRSFVVSGADLVTDHTWFITDQEATDDSAQVVGSLILASSNSSSTGTWNLQLDIDYKFKGLGTPTSLALIVNGVRAEKGECSHRRGECSCPACHKATGRR
jgi:hypothetical protein